MIPLLYVASQQRRAEALTAWCEPTKVATTEFKQTLSTARTEPALVLDELGLALLMPGYRDFYRLPQQQVHRRANDGRLGELARACGLPQAKPTVLDACAGFGTDGLTLASLGCAVTMVEQMAIVWLLLNDLIYDLDGVTAEHGDCVDLLQSDRCWDVVYLDPMFAPRRKNALPSRGLQHLRELTSKESENGTVPLPKLIELARASALNRVVVKRRLKDPQEPESAFQIKGKSIRFDVYLP